MVFQFMELIFNRRIIRSQSLRGMSQEIKEKFGDSSKYVVHLKFRKVNEWDIFKYPFVFDTGAFLSYAPESILEDLNIEPEFELVVGGIQPNEECKVKTKVVKTSFKIIDDYG